MTCKECAHYNVCNNYSDIISYYNITKFNVETNCEYFLHSNAIVKLPLPAEDWLRKELTEYCEKRCVEEL